MRAAAWVLCLAGFAATADAKLSPLAAAPDWSALNAYQETITREDFLELLDKVYAPGGAWRGVIQVGKTSALVTTRPGQMPFVLRFAPSRALAKAVPAYWRTRGQLPPEEPAKPLAGLHVAIDPGHIGGPWAKVEERWFQIGRSKPVTEGDMTLTVAKLLAARLEDLGARVSLTRSRAAPVTSLRPAGLKKEALASLADKGAEANPESIQKESERLFYRAGEIRRRAKLVNGSIRPDVVLCLHFNAEAWGDPAKPELVSPNHLHFLVTGAASADELAYEDQRFDMLVKLLSRSFNEEVALTNAIAPKMASATGLPPYRYLGSAAVRVNSNPYIWARNLLANRLFTCPVVYVEPYVMNNRSVHARIQAGNYQGLKKFGGVMRKSIFREYADAIAAGLVAYYSGRPL